MKRASDRREKNKKAGWEKAEKKKFSPKWGEGERERENEKRANICENLYCSTTKGSLLRLIIERRGKYFSGLSSGQS